MERKAWTYLSATITNFACLIGSIVSGIVAARLLGPDARGELATILYYPGMISSVFCLSVPQALAYLILKEPQHHHTVVAAGVKLALVLMTVGAISFALLAPLSLPSNFRHLATQVAIACVVGAPMVLNTHLAAIHRGLHHFDLVNLVLLIGSFSYPLVLLLVWRLGAVSVLSFALSSLTIQWFLAALYLRRLGQPVLRCHVGWALYRKIFLQGIKLFLPAIALTVYGLSDRALLIRLGTPTDLGFYAVACAVGFPVAMAAEAFAQLGFIEIAGQKGSREVTDLLARRFQMVQVVVFLAIAILLPMAYPAIRFGFGMAFLPALGATQVMIIAMGLRGLSRSLELSMRANNLVAPGIVSSAVALVGLAITSWWLVPKRGCLGFSEAVLVAESGSLLILLTLAKRSFGFRFRELWGITPAIFRVLIRHVLSLVNPKGETAR